MTEIVLSSSSLTNNNHQSNTIIMSSQSSPDTSPQHPWPMVPVLQTLTVLSDGEEEQMEQKMGIENGLGNGGYSVGNNNNTVTGLSMTKMAIDNVVQHLHQQQQQQQQQHQRQSLIHNQSKQHSLSNSQKRKVGRPITSVKTMNRSFPAVDEIRAKLEAGECYVRPRASSSSSDVWALFQEVAYKDNHVFTGIVQCKTCHFLTRYHGQITGTSHMRRHHCFSLLFPNSTPANRKPKINNNNNNNNAIPIQSSINNGNNNNRSNGVNTTTFNISDADSTTPRMLKRIKKDSAATTTTTIAGRQIFSNNHLNLNDTTTATLLSSPTTTTTLNNQTTNAHITIHPALPKKKFKNQSPVGISGGVIHHATDTRSLISNGGMAVTMTTKSPSPSSSSASSSSSVSSQSMLHPRSSNNNGYNSPSSSATATNTTTINGQRNIQHIRQDLRERIVQFCAEELIPLQSIISDSFKSILQSYLRLCTQQVLQQFYQQPQLLNVATTLSSCINHLPVQSPDLEQLQSYQLQLYRQCLDRIRSDINTNLDENPGSALVCDSDNDACIMSVHYVDSRWQLTEAILSASGMVVDINRFVARTLDDYNLQDRKKLGKFTFVSHGGQFGGVSVCLSSMAHIVDKVVEESMAIVTDNEDSSHPLLELFDSCHNIAIRLNLQPIIEQANPYDVDWIGKYELLKAIDDNSQSIDDQDKSIDFKLISILIKLLEPFRTASNELRQCSNHPTLCHVLLYFYKLKKVLSSTQHITGLINNNNNNNQNKNINNNNHNARRNSKSTKKMKNNTTSSESDSDSNEEKETFDSLNNNTGDKNNDEKSNKNDDDNDGDDDDDVDENKDQINLNRLIQNLRQALMDNLEKYYKVQSLHRIATFLWPNFRLLKMLTSDEQKEVHEDVRKLIQTRVKCTNNLNNSNNGQITNDCGIGDSHNDGDDPDNNNINMDISNGNGSNDNLKNKSKSNFDEWEIFSDEDQDEVDKYLSVQLTSCSEHFVLNWWREHSQEFPKLSQLAKWILSIPASVTTRERFKITKNCQIDDMLLFLHCNMKTEKFDLATLKRSLKQQSSSTSKSKNRNSINSNNFNVSAAAVAAAASSSLIAN